MAWAWQKVLPPGQKLVLLALADHSDEDGRCWPGLEHVAGKCDLSERQVRRNIDALARVGLLRKTTRFGDIRGRRTDMYVLNMGDADWAEKDDNMSGCSEPIKRTFEADQADNMSGCSEPINRTFATDQPDICDSALKEEPSRTVSKTPPVSPREKKSARKPKPPEVQLPGWVDAETWSAFVDMRKKIRKPMTDHAKQLALNKLAKLREAGQDANEVLRQSIMNSYQGLFPVKSDETTQRTFTSREQRVQGIGAAIDRNAERAARELGGFAFRETEGDLPGCVDEPVLQ